MALQALQIISCGLEVSQDCFPALSIDVIRSQIAFFYDLLKGIIGKVLQGKYAAFCQLQLFFLRVAEWFRGLLLEAHILCQIHVPEAVAVVEYRCHAFEGKGVGIPEEAKIAIVTIRVLDEVIKCNQVGKIRWLHRDRQLLDSALEMSEC